MHVKVRPKGLGLGADRSVLENAAKAIAKSAKEGEEELKIIVGAFVQVLSGKHQGLYGQVRHKFDSPSVSSSSFLLPLQLID